MKLKALLIITLQLLYFTRLTKFTLFTLGALERVFVRLFFFNWGPVQSLPSVGKAWSLFAILQLVYNKEHFGLTIMASEEDYKGIHNVSNLNDIQIKCDHYCTNTMLSLPCKIILFLLNFPELTRKREAFTAKYIGTLVSYCKCKNGERQKD